MIGQEIAEMLGKMRGTKPTPGTIYPALRELRKHRLIDVKKEGRTTSYSLTEKGVKELRKACEYFCFAFGEIFEKHSAERSKRQSVKAEGKFEPCS